MKIGKETVILPAILLVIAPTALGLAVTPPSLFFGIDPSSQDIQVGSSSTFTVNIYPQGDWKTGTVTLALVNPPQGVTATFSPEKMENIELDGTTAKMTVKVAADAPQGKITLTVEGTGTALPQSGQQSVDLESKSDVTLNIVSSTQKTTSTSTSSSSTVTATVTSLVTATVVTTTTSTFTIISTERSPGAAPIPKISANNDTTLAIAALGVAAVLFVAGLLFLQQKPVNHIK